MAATTGLEEREWSFIHSLLQHDRIIGLSSCFSRQAPEEQATDELHALELIELWRCGAVAVQPVMFCARRFGVLLVGAQTLAERLKLPDKEECVDGRVDERLGS